MKPHSIDWDSIDLNRPASVIAKEVGCHVSNVMRRQRHRGVLAPRAKGGATPGSGRFQKAVAANPDLLLLGPNEVSRRLGCTMTRAYALCNGVSWKIRTGKPGAREIIPEETEENKILLQGKLVPIAHKLGVSVGTAMNLRKKFREGTLWVKKVVEA